MFGLEEILGLRTGREYEVACQTERGCLGTVERDFITKLLGANAELRRGYEILIQESLTWKDERNQKINSFKAHLRSAQKTGYLAPDETLGNLSSATFP